MAADWSVLAENALATNLRQWGKEYAYTAPGGSTQVTLTGIELVPSRLPASPAYLQAHSVMEVATDADVAVQGIINFPDGRQTVIRSIVVSPDAGKQLVLVLQRA